MGLDEGSALINKAHTKTLGATLNQISKMGLISNEIEGRFKKLLAERNWLVHRSRSDNRNVIYHDQSTRALIFRLEVIADEALSLLKYVGSEIKVFTQKQGVSPQYIERMTNEILEQWQAADSF